MTAITRQGRKHPALQIPALIVLFVGLVSLIAFNLGDRVPLHQLITANLPHDGKEIAVAPGSSALTGLTASANHQVFIPMVAADSSGSPSGPCDYGPYAVPGRIQAEDFMCGGAGAAFNEEQGSGPGSGNYRSDVGPEGPDLQNTADAGGGYNVGWTRQSEWLRYFVDISTADSYDIILRVASGGNSGRFAVKLDGVALTGERNVPNTGGWQNWTNLTISDLALPGGNHTLELFITGAYANYNYIDIVPAGTTPPPPPPPTGDERGRVQIVNNNVVADNGWPLRGEAIFLTDPEGSTTGNFTLGHLYDLSYWQALRDDFHLNTVRLFVMRPPQYWGGGPGEECWPWSNPPYRCYPLDHPLNPPDTALDVIDDVVDIASQMGMYIIIDYHPVGGHDEADAIQWWTQIAPRYEDRTHVIYELANEPVAWNASAYGPDDIQFEEDLFALIRSLAPDTHTILWSFAHGAGPMVGVVNQGSTIDYANASVGYHPYVYNRTDILTLRSNYPVINTEIGGGFHQGMTQEAEDIGVSWIGLGGARTHNVGDSDGFFPADVYWSADPGATSPP